MKFRKKPIVIEAIRWDGTVQTLTKLQNAGMQTARYSAGSQIDGIDNLVISTLEGDHEVSLGDWVIKGIKGEFYPCKPDIFEATYDSVVESCQEAIK